MVDIWVSQSREKGRNNGGLVGVMSGDGQKVYTNEGWWWVGYMVGGWWVRWWTGRDGMRVGMVEDD